MPRRDLPTYSDYHQLMSAIAGVWEGTYTHLHPNGELMERFASRQETRLRGTAWYERIIYRRNGQEPEVLDFRAIIDSGTEPRVTFDDDHFHGVSYLVEGRLTVFPYYWKHRTDQEIVEIIVLQTEDYRTRLWQTFENDRLVRLTVIEEERRRGQTPDEWE